jgi:DNA-directed RNA polymerase subunit K/omega
LIKLKNELDIHFLIIFKRFNQIKMDEYDETAQYANDYDDYQEEEEANGHYLDEEDVENEKLEEKIYDDEEEENPSEDEFEEEGILGLEKEQEDNIDDFKADSGAGATKTAKKEPVQQGKIVPPSKRKTNPIMTKFEYSYLISQRAMMIENDSPLMIPNTKFRNSIDIAKEETEMKVNPIILQRTLPNGMIEEWKCSELSLPKNYIK